MVVQCTWKSSEGRDINDAISWTLADESPENDVEEEVQAENCLLLVAPSDTTSGFLAPPACQLLISCHPLQQIQYISVLSDARVIEVYGHHGEYLKTIKNELLEEVEDMAVFKGDIQFEKTLNVCSMKFACLRSKAEMWLYGVKVGLVNVPNVENGQISYAEVERRLSEMGSSLSDKAKAFKELVEAHSEFPGSQNQDISAFINLFKSVISSNEQLNLQNINNNQSDANGHPNTNDIQIAKVNTDEVVEVNGDEIAEVFDDAIAEICSDSITEDYGDAVTEIRDNSITEIHDDALTEFHDDALTEFHNDEGTEIKENKISEDSNSKVEVNADVSNDNGSDKNNNTTIEFNDSTTQTMDPPPPNIEDILKLHVDQKLEELEKQLSEKMEKSFKEMEAKIFCKLEEIESFVKPQGVQ